MKLIPKRPRRHEVSELRSDWDNMWSRLFDAFDGDWRNRLPAAFSSGLAPAINVDESETDFNVEVELPGLDEKDISIEIMGDQLVISGERKWEEEQKDKEFHRVESQYGTFQRTVRLPNGLKTGSGDVEATYRKGMLRIRLPKVEPTPTRKISVRSE